MLTKSNVCFCSDYVLLSAIERIKKMEFWVGVTDNNWYEFLANLKPNEVNFWQPSGTPAFKKQLELFLFKLHSPLNYIVGGGYFITYTNLPISLAWETFGEKNGVASYVELRNIILAYKKSHGRSLESDPDIGCSVLAQPFFFERENWIPIPEDWKSNIVRGKTYNTQSAIGKKLWEDVQNRLTEENKILREFDPLSEKQESTNRYGSEYLTRARIGQGSFQVLVTNAYHRRCSMTGEKTLPALEAAHIQSYSENGPHKISNGLLLRADIHRLFDKHYITITTDLKIEVSKLIHEKFENGKDYYKLHGKELAILPINSNDLPSRQYIEWHNRSFCG
jgi:putative restriction endonuclease